MRIRPVTPAEHDAFIATAARAGISSPSVPFYLTHPASTAYIVEEDGQVVGTGAAIRHQGETGWLAAITVDPDRQGRGLGRALVEWGEESLRQRGAESVVLLASERGRPMYEKMGYSVGLTYHSYQGMGRSILPESPLIRPMEEADWPAVTALDRSVTGEERAPLLRAMSSGYVVGEAGEMRGFYLPAPWGGGPAMAEDPVAGRLLIDLALGVHGPQPIILRTTEANREAIAYLEWLGLTPRSRTTYMVKGRRPEPYRPESIWGMFSFGLG